MKLNSFLFFIAISLFAGQLLAQQRSILLNSNWKFKQQDSSVWRNARVPGTVHTDLLNNKIIDNPFYRDNETKLQWIEKENWEYETTFNVDETILNKKDIELVFDGLDTYANVYLNGQLILKADNMFRQWKTDVKKIIRKKDNHLYILFLSAQNIVDSIAKNNLPLVVPDNPRVYARKAQYNFGWDFAVKLTTCGIWKNIWINSFDKKELKEPKTSADNHVKLIQKKDRFGESFYFTKDNKPIYIKGANWIPVDIFLPRITKEKYRSLLVAAKDAGMNMLRVWGGGVYEDDYFYQLCDSLGIMVWQDLMFAGGMIPNDEHFFNNVKEEIKYQVTRLRKYKCIVLWCGNNEIDEAWHNWDWQKQFSISPEDSTKMWNDYKRLFQDSIPKWIKQYDGSRQYISTSPKYGWGNEKSFSEGDSHYWGVWWGLDSIESFKNKTGRFVSEYGMQALPTQKTVEEFTKKEDRFLFSDIIKDHQKANEGFNKINYYLNKYFIDTTKLFPCENAITNSVCFDNYIYLTQCMQYYALKNSIIYQMKNYPKNMGTLVWQLDDCWPGASWSIIDYYGRKKGGYYAVKQTYRNDIINYPDSVYPKNLHLENPQIKIYVSGKKIILRASSFAKYVFLYSNDASINFSDNYFDIKSGETKEIFIDKLISQKEIDSIKIKSLFDVVGN